MFLVRILSRLPWVVMLGISNFMYWTAYKVLRYRVKVVDQNLRNSFPDKSAKELKEIRRKYYRSFFDFIMEVLKAVTISNTEIRRRVTFANPDFFKATSEESGIVVLGTHFFNWEVYGMAMSELFDRKIVFSYQKLSSNFSDTLMLNTRSKFGAKGVLRHETAKAIIGGRKSFTGFYVLADQAPVGKAQRYWTRFLNQNTSFYHGIGKVSKLANTPVMVILPKKVKRGYYEITFKWVAENLEEVTGEEILERYIEILEKHINENPSEWLWTHKRWKTKPKEEDIISDRIEEDVKE